MEKKIEKVDFNKNGKLTNNPNNKAIDPGVDYTDLINNKYDSNLETFDFSQSYKPQPRFISPSISKMYIRNLWIGDLAKKLLDFFGFTLEKDNKITDVKKTPKKNEEPKRTMLDGINIIFNPVSGYVNDNGEIISELTEDHKGRVTSIKNYEHIFKTYGEKYSVDHRITMAIACQEGYGDPYSEQLKYNSCAYGVMQIENVNWNKDITAYNFNDHVYETFNYKVNDNKNIITNKTIEDNVRAGTMLFRNAYDDAIEKYNNGQIRAEDILPFALQEYNMGAGNANKIAGIDWRLKREDVGAGDPLYYEQVFAYIKEFGANNPPLKFSHKDDMNYYYYVNND